jgi:hypothetical protein
LSVFFGISLSVLLRFTGPVAPLWYFQTFLSISFDATFSTISVLWRIKLVVGLNQVYFYLFFCFCLFTYLFVCLFVVFYSGGGVFCFVLIILFLLAIVMSVFLRFTEYDYPRNKLDLIQQLVLCAIIQILY